MANKPWMGESNEPLARSRTFERFCLTPIVRTLIGADDADDGRGTEANESGQR
jgi:hypothetical protein